MWSVILSPSMYDVWLFLYHFVIPRWSIVVPCGIVLLACPCICRLDMKAENVDTRDSIYSIQSRACLPNICFLYSQLESRKELKIIKNWKAGILRVKQRRKIIHLLIEYFCLPVNYSLGQMYQKCRRNLSWYKHLRVGGYENHSHNLLLNCIKPIAYLQLAWGQ